MPPEVTRDIDVYSLPRSGTNLFCSDLVLAFCLRGLSVGGGHHPLLAKPIFSHPKVAEEKSTTMRDEMKFFYWTKDFLAGPNRLQNHREVS